MDALLRFLLARLESTLDGYRTGSRAAAWQGAYQLLAGLLGVM